jgi:ParB family transcriptional regulator, chromosome partitioning protein
MTERRLGRGLDSLITRTTEAVGGQVVEVPLDAIQPNPDQPRSRINEAALEGLAQSIRTHGVLQPIVVQRVAGGFQLIAGERRFRASRLAGRGTVPALVIEAQGVKSLELALIENVQRENLGALEEAVAYEALLTKAGLTHQDLAARLGKSRAAVTNTLRLLELPDEVKRLLGTGALSAGQARALLAVGSPDQMLSLAEAACRESWSVREVEQRARQQPRNGSRRRKGATVRPDRPMGDYEEQLRHLYGTKVTIDDRNGRGDVRFAFYSGQDRGRLIHLLLTAGAAAAELEEREAPRV